MSYNKTIYRLDTRGAGVIIRASSYVCPSAYIFYWLRLPQAITLTTDNRETNTDASCDLKQHFVTSSSHEHELIRDFCKSYAVKANYCRVCCMFLDEKTVIVRFLSLPFRNERLRNKNVKAQSIRHTRVTNTTCADASVLSIKHDEVFHVAIGDAQKAR